MEVGTFLFFFVLTILLLVKGLSSMGYEVFFSLQIVKGWDEGDDGDGDIYHEPVHDYDGGVPVGDEWRGN